METTVYKKKAIYNYLETKYNIKKMTSCLLLVKKKKKTSQTVDIL